MPSVNFVGEIESAFADCSGALALSWGILPGNRAWTLRAGECSGETQVGISHDITDSVALNHPIDAYYETTSCEGWPFIVVEVWDKSEFGARNFVGCGSAWLPMKSGVQILDINIWKPSAEGMEYFSEALLPTTPDLKLLREIIVNPYMRSQLHTNSTGDVRIKLNTVLAGFDVHGVTMS
jgi:hypothetical protein